MGGFQASSNVSLRRPALGFPSEPGCLAVRELRRTYFGSFRAGVRVLLDTSKERRKDCEAKVLDNIEGQKGVPAGTGTVGQGTWCHVTAP